MACTRGSQSGEPARSQAARRASIAQSAAYLCVPTATGPPSGASAHVRTAASGRRVHGSVRRQRVVQRQCRLLYLRAGAAIPHHRAAGLLAHALAHDHGVFLPVLALLLGVYLWQRRAARHAGAGAPPVPAAGAAVPSVRAISTISATFGNSVQLDIPMAAALFGEAGLAIHIALVSLRALVLLTLLTAMVETAPPNADCRSSKPATQPAYSRRQSRSLRAGGSSYGGGPAGRSAQDRFCHRAQELGQR